jgi:hypothetical protein
MSQRVRIVLLWLAVFAVLLSGAYFFTLDPSPLVYHPKIFRERKYDLIIAWMKANKAVAKGPMVLLPPELAALSVTGRVYATDDLVFVPSWIGRRTLMGDDSWIEGFLFSAKPVPAPPGDSAHGVMNVPGFCSPQEASHNTAVGEIDMYLGERIGEHWYEADSFSSGQPNDHGNRNTGRSVSVGWDRVGCCV